MVAAFFVVYALIKHYKERKKQGQEPMIVIGGSNSEDTIGEAGVNKTKFSSVASEGPEQPLMTMRLDGNDMNFEKRPSKQTPSDGTDSLAPLVEIVQHNHDVDISQLSPDSTADTQMSSSVSVDSSK